MTLARRAPLRALMVGAMSAVLIVAGPVSASFAHDELLDSEPADGVEVQTPPDGVVLEFSGEIAPVGTFVVIEGPLGEVTDGEPVVEGSAVTQPLLADVPPGDYSVTWRVTSSDGHPISGEFGYTVASAGPEAQGDEPSDPAEGGATPDDDASTGTGPPPPPDNAEATGIDRAADTAAAPASGDASGDSGTAPWVWGVLALAIVTLGGLGAVAVRRR
ncbi:MAG: copper resistance CopC family protein [Ornithinimicrobium sp.]